MATTEQLVSAIEQIADEQTTDRVKELIAAKEAYWTFDPEMYDVAYLHSRTLHRNLLILWLDESTPLDMEVSDDLYVQDTAV